MFYHNQPWNLILEMTYFDLEYLSSWHDRFDAEEKKAINEMKGKDA